MVYTQVAVKKSENIFSGKSPVLRVCAYTRVSSGKDAMLHSLSNQVNFYREYIQSKPNWSYSGVFIDEAETGTKDSRDSFQDMVTECRKGNIDMVITKSISRFARNTETLLNTVRELKSIGVDVFFEEQNIHSMSNDGELMLTIFASFAQEESHSVSENQKWRVRKNFQEGKVWGMVPIGYKQVGGFLYVIPDEAELVKRIFNEYLLGYGYAKIAKALNEDGVKSKFGYKWNQSSVRAILKNNTYTGDLLLQKYYNENYLTKRKTRNTGQLPMYSVKNSHEAIIDKETFDKVQKLMEKKASRFVKAKKPKEKYDFSELIRCEKCGAYYNRCTSHNIVFWNCSTYKRHGKAQCTGSRIHESMLYEITKDVAPLENIKGISINEDNLTYTLNDGKQITKKYSLVSRSESWTDEMKKRASEKSMNQWRAYNGKNNNLYTCDKKHSYSQNHYGQQTT